MVTPMLPAALTVEDLDQVVVIQAFRLNDIALKWIRDHHEHPPGFPTAPAVDLTGTDPFTIGVYVEGEGWD